MFGFKQVKDDPLYNRRRFMIFMSAFGIVWGFIILALSIYFEMDTPKTIAFLGYITTLSGAGLFQYHKASAEQDKQSEE